MKTVYIAGPFRGANAWEVEQNVRRAEALAYEVWKSGAGALCPHSNTRFFDKALPDDVFLQGDLALLAKMDAVIMTPDWQRSKGATEEKKKAMELGIPVFESLSSLQLWLSLQELTQKT